MGPVCGRDPASAKPNPSRIDFLPSSMTSPGISSYFVETTNLPTYSVRPGALGKSFRGALPVLPIEAERRVDPSTPREVLPKSRLNKVHPLTRTFNSSYSAVSMENSDSRTPAAQIDPQRYCIPSSCLRQVPASFLPVTEDPGVVFKNVASPAPPPVIPPTYANPKTKCPVFLFRWPTIKGAK